MEAFNTNDVLQGVRSPDGPHAWTVKDTVQNARPRSSFSLDEPLMEIPTSKGAGVWTVGNAVEGVQIFGGIGSGKTSGSGRTSTLR